MQGLLGGGRDRCASVVASGGAARALPSLPSAASNKWPSHSRSRFEYYVRDASLFIRGQYCSGVPSRAITVVETETRYIRASHRLVFNALEHYLRAWLNMPILLVHCFCTLAYLADVRSTCNSILDTWLLCLCTAEFAQVYLAFWVEALENFCKTFAWFIRFLES